MSIMKKTVAYARTKEPAVTLGALASLLLAAQHQVAGAASWRDAAPLLASWVIRRFVSPAA